MHKRYIKKQEIQHKKSSIERVFAVIKKYSGRVISDSASEEYIDPTFYQQYDKFNLCVLYDIMEFFINQQLSATFAEKDYISKDLNNV